MTGRLSQLTDLHLVSGFRFYKSDNQFKIINSTTISFDNLINYDRRFLNYSYVPKDFQEPIFLKYTNLFTVLKILIPKDIIKIVPINTLGEPDFNYEGVFNDPSSPQSMFEFNNYKWLTLMESSIDNDLNSYFITLHEDNLFDSHREDYELISGNIQSKSVVNKYLMSEYLKNNSADFLGNTLVSSDASIISLGNYINNNIENIEENTHEKGCKVLGFLVDKSFNCYYFGSIIGSGIRIPIMKDKKDLYGRWVNDIERLPEKPFIWGKTIFKEDNEVE